MWKKSATFARKLKTSTEMTKKKSNKYTTFYPLKKTGLKVSETELLKAKKKK